MTDTRIDEKALERARKAALLAAANYGDTYKAFLTEYLAARAEAGFVEVPRNPTNVMIYEAARARGIVPVNFGSDLVESYRAMIAARPS